MGNKMQGQDRNDEQQKDGRINGLEVHWNLGIWDTDFSWKDSENGMSEITMSKPRPWKWVIIMMGRTGSPEK